MYFCSDNAHRWLSKLHPILHRGVKRAGRIGASYGFKDSFEQENPYDIGIQHRESENKCRKKYDQCTVLHDSYRFPGLIKRYINAAMLAKDYESTKNYSWLRKIREAADLDEYQKHEMKIFKTFQDKINLHELQKWLVNEN